MNATYVFRVQARFDTPAGVDATPETVETVVEVDADPPGEGDWLFFRDVLWRGELSDDRRGRELAASWLGTSVDDVQFSELRLDTAYREALETAIASHPRVFDGDSPRDVIHRHLGSSLRVVDG